MNRATTDRRRLLLHCCCGPCATAVYERLSAHYEVICYWYNPNIQPAEEARKRLEAMRKLARAWPSPGMDLVVEGVGEQAWGEAIVSLEDEPEGGRRCEACFAVRLHRAAEKAAELGCDCFATTLTVSPHKSSETVNRCGEAASEATGVQFVAMDFKKDGGFQRSAELARQYRLHRQSYCGCLYSLRR